MALFTKQQKVTKAKLTRKEPFKSNKKFDAMNPLWGKLKGNNNKLAHVLSLTRAENQLLFSQNVEFSKEIQMLHQACREREVAITHLHNNLEEVLHILDPVLNFITKGIKICKKFIPEEEIVSRQANVPQATIENGVTTPSVITNHGIAKAAVKQRKAHEHQMNNIVELNAIEEECTEFMNNPTDDANSMPSTSSGTASRINITGREQQLRLQRIAPVETAGPLADAREVTSCIEAYGLSGRRSDVYAPRHSRNMPMGRTLSPRVRRSNATILQSNSHAPHIGMSQDSRREDWLDNTDGLSHERNDHMMASELCERDVQEENGQSHDVISHSQATNHLQLNDANDGRSGEQTMHNQQRRSIHSVISKNQRGWIMYNNSECFILWNKNSLSRIDTNGDERNKDAERDKNNMLSEHVPSDEDTTEMTMDLTECIRTAQQQQNAANIRNTRVTNNEQCTVQNDAVYDRNVCENVSEIREEPIIEPAFAISRTFITTRRGVPSDDDDEDTMMLHVGSTAQNGPVSLNELRLPILNNVTISHRNRSKSETTGTPRGSRQSSTHASRNTTVTNTEQSTVQNDAVYDRNVCENVSEIREQSAIKPAYDISRTFITTRRGVPSDDDDEDTMILHVGSTAQNGPFSANELRLPILNNVTISHRNRSKSETTETRRGSRQSSTHLSKNTSIDLSPSSDIETQNSSSDSRTLLLSMSRRSSTTPRCKKKWRRIVNHHNDRDGDSSSSDCDEPANGGKITIRKKKLFGTEQSSPNVTNQAGPSKSQRHEASTISEVPGLQRPRRAKAPTNLKEPSLNKKLRRN